MLMATATPECYTYGHTLYRPRALPCAAVAVRRSPTPTPTPASASKAPAPTPAPTPAPKPIGVAIDRDSGPVGPGFSIADMGNAGAARPSVGDRKSTRLNSSH